MQNRIEKMISQLNKLIGTKEIHNKISIKFSEILKSYLSDKFFRLECLEAFLSKISVDENNWTKQPIYINTESKYSINIIFWPIDATNSPHLHKYWTVSGVLFGQLNFSTYTLENKSSFSLLKTNEYCGTTGKVGYILPPCIHSVSNIGSTGAISIHIFSYSLPDEITMNSEEYQKVNTVWFGEQKNFSDFESGYVMDTVFSFLNEYSIEDALNCYHLISKNASNGERLKATKIIYDIDSKLGLSLLVDLKNSCTALNKARIEDLITKLNKVI